MPDTLADGILVARAKEDPAAFGALYERYLGNVYNYVYYRVGNVAEAEDLTARVFYQALTHVAAYVDRGAPFVAWLYRIAHNLVANWYRDQHNRRTFSLDGPTQLPETPDGDRGLHDQATDREDARELRAALSRLPADRQQLIMLKYVAGLSNAEIGATMGKSEGAVKALLHRTLLSLRGDLAPAMLLPAESSDGGTQRL
jgi:RNA polymerase sigma-70 factor (ECF subfamily)